MPTLLPKFAWLSLYLSQAPPSLIDSFNLDWSSAVYHRMAAMASHLRVIVYLGRHWQYHSCIFSLSSLSMSTAIEIFTRPFSFFSTEIFL